MTIATRACVWGTGGVARVAADLLRALGWEVVGFIGDPSDPVEEGGVVVAAVEENDIRIRGLEVLGSRCAGPIVHPSASVSPFATIGRGSIVCAGARVNAGARIGEGVILESAVIIEHDCDVGDGARVGAGAILTGAVRVQQLSRIGANATILPGMVVGRAALVAEGAVVNRDVSDNSVVAGAPARAIQRDR